LAPVFSLPNPPKVLFTSSTGIYGSSSGVITETSPIAADTASGKAVAAAEAWLQEQPVSLTICRLAGLIGPDRHPGRFYSGRTIPQGDAPVNLVVQADVIDAIRLIIRSGLPQGIYNVCAASHPPKGDYYSAAAKAIGLEADGQQAGGEDEKEIDSTKLRAIGWQPASDDLLLY
jgi:nucleoside-diphosphate-sugar epimerase